MVAAKLNESRLFVNVNGGGTLSGAYAADLKAGANKIALPTLGRDASAGDIDVMEDVAKGTKVGSLTLERVSVDNRNGKNVKNTGGTLIVRSKERQHALFSVTAGLNASVQIKHRLSITPDGIAELSSQALVTNSSLTPIKNANLTITAGDNQSRSRPMFAKLAGRSYEAADTGVAAVGSSVYRFDHPNKLSLKPGESVAVNLYNQDFALGQVDKVLAFEGSGGNTDSKDPRTTEAGPVSTTYYVENTKENGLGVVLPRGAMRIVQPDGTLLSNTQIEDTSVGKRLQLDGGQSFDMEAKRTQTSFEKMGAMRAAGGRGEGKFQTVQVEQELSFNNCGKVDNKINVSDQIPVSPDAANPTKILSVSVDGVALAADKWSYDEQQGKLSIDGIAVAAGKDAKVAFKIETVSQVY